MPGLAPMHVLTSPLGYRLTRHPHNVPTPTDLLDAELRRDGARPFLTYYDAGTGERVELSVATTANWVAKTANYLLDELGADPGDTITVRLPLHWQAAIMLLAAWSAGLAVTSGEADVVVTDDEGNSTGARDVVELSLAPMGADFSRLVAAQPDVFVPAAASGHDAVASAPGVPPGARVLTVVPLVGEGVGYGLLGPLAASGSLVYIRHADRADLAAIATTERVTHTFGASVAGLPEL
jgi:uncharacterized protein (TIGR03089 family)